MRNRQHLNFQWGGQKRVLGGQNEVEGVSEKSGGGGVKKITAGGGGVKKKLGTLLFFNVFVKNVINHLCVILSLTLN